MHIREEHASAQTALPKAARVLQDLRNVPTYEEAYGSRHPFGAYNISLAAVGRRARSVVTSLAEVEHQLQILPNRSEAVDESLLEATDHLLDSLMEHMDVCGSIIRSFFAPDDEKRFKKCLSNFKSSVEPYRKHIGGIDNYIKHNQGKLRSIRFAWVTGMTLGYFVEGPVGNGTLGPVDRIHKGGNTAFSFNRDLPFHLCQVFAIGAHLASALHSIDQRLVPLPVPNEVATRDSDWCEALKSVSALPQVFFPDEIAKPAPAVQVLDQRVRIEYPVPRPKVISPPPQSRIDLLFVGDGATRSFRMPYYREER